MSSACVKMYSHTHALRSTLCSVFMFFWKVSGTSLVVTSRLALSLLSNGNCLHYETASVCPFQPCVDGVLDHVTQTEKVPKHTCTRPGLFSPPVANQERVKLGASSCCQLCGFSSNSFCPIQMLLMICSDRKRDVVMVIADNRQIAVRTR